MAFDYANTDPNRSRPRFGSRLVPLLIGLAIVAFGALATRNYSSLSRDADPRREKPAMPETKATPTATKP